jgi:hypothetical protein
MRESLLPAQVNLAAAEQTAAALEGRHGKTG